MPNKQNDNNGLLTFLQSHPIMIFTLSALILSGLGYWSEYSLMQKFGLNIVVFAALDDFLLAGFKYPVISGTLFIPTILAVIISTWWVSLSQISIEALEWEFSHKKNNLEAEIKVLKSPDLAVIIGSRQAEKKISQLESEIKSLDTSKERKNIKQVKTTSMLLAIFSLFIATIIALYTVNKTSEKLFKKITESPTQQVSIELRTKNIIPESGSKPLIFITATENYLFFHQFGTKNTISIPVASVAQVVYQPFISPQTGKGISTKPAAGVTEAVPTIK